MTEIYDSYPDISIHAPRAGSDPAKRGREHYRGISIHAPRAGSDSAPARCFCRTGISIHAPRAGSDIFEVSNLFCPKEFQSTLPVRGATGSW